MLENCPNITSVNFSGCDGYSKDWILQPIKKVSEGIYGMLFCECSFVFGVPVRFFWKNFLPSMRILREFSRVARRTCRNFLEFSSLYSTVSLTHSCPACLLILFHSGDIQVLEKCTQLTKVNFHKCRRITGACCLEERSFSRLRPSAPFL